MHITNISAETNVLAAFLPREILIIIDHYNRSACFAERVKQLGTQTFVKSVQRPFGRPNTCLIRFHSYLFEICKDYTYVWVSDYSGGYPGISLYRRKERSCLVGIQQLHIWYKIIDSSYCALQTASLDIYEINSNSFYF